MKAPRAWKNAGVLSAAGGALALTAGFGGLLAFVSRSVNRPPVITQVDFDPPFVTPGVGQTVRVRAEDSDGGPLRFTYEAKTGRIAADALRPGEARYTRAEDGGLADRVTITVTDAQGLRTSRQIAIEAGAPAAAPAPTAAAAPTDVPTEVVTPPAAVAVASETTPPAPPTPALVVPTRAIAPTAAPSRAPRTNRSPSNQPPILEGGYTAKVGSRTVHLMATGHDPDGDPIEHEWDLSGCFEIVTESRDVAEVKFIDGCISGTVTLKWTDAHGAQATTVWTLRQ
jgi:hypothetical protein